jgi:hypothetical protein
MTSLWEIPIPKRAFSSLDNQRTGESAMVCNVIPLFGIQSMGRESETTMPMT